MKRITMCLSIVLIIFLVGCTTKPIEYTVNELLPDSRTTDFEISEGIYKDYLVENGYLVGISNYEEIVDGIDYEYLRYISTNDDFMQMLREVADCLELYFDDIENAFKNPEDIEYIVLNTDLGIFSILPSDLDDLTNKNAVIIDFELFLSEHTSYDIEHFEALSGFNFRDIFVALFNIEYSSTKIELFKTQVGATNGFLITNVLYLDILISENNGVQSTSFIYIHSGTPIPMFGNLTQELPVEQIPIEFSYTNDEKDDVLITSLEDLYITFYYNGN